MTQFNLRKVVNKSIISTTSLKLTNGYLTNFLYHDRDRSDQGSHSRTGEKRKRAESYEEEQSEILTDSSSSETESEDWSDFNERDKRELRKTLRRQYPQHFKDSTDCEPDSDDSYYYQQSPKTEREHSMQNEQDENRQEILEQVVNKNEETIRERYYNVKTPVIDAHCHFGQGERRERGQLRRYVSNPESLMKQIIDNEDKNFSRNFHGAVINFSEPKNWRREEELMKKAMEDERIAVTIGCHPKSAIYWNKEYRNFLIRFIKENKAKVQALGEIGLDKTQNPENKDIERCQRKVLCEQLAIAESEELNIVLHIRDIEGKRKAEEEIFDILKHFKINGLHRHCFTGRKEDLERYEQKFKKLLIGIPPKICAKKYREEKEYREVMKSVKEEHYALETDKPHFRRLYKRAIPEIEIEIPTSGYVNIVAEEYAKIRQMQITDTIMDSTGNIKNFYNMRINLSTYAENYYARPRIYRLERVRESRQKRIRTLTVQDTTSSANQRIVEWIDNEETQ